MGSYMKIVKLGNILYDILDGESNDKRIESNEEGYFDLYQVMNAPELKELNPTSRDIVGCVNETNMFCQKEFRMIMHRVMGVEKYFIKIEKCYGATTYTECRL